MKTLEKLKKEFDRVLRETLDNSRFGLQEMLPAKAPEGWRTPRRFAEFDGVWQSRQRLECGGFSTAIGAGDGNKAWQLSTCALGCNRKAALNAPHSRRFARFEGFRQSRQRLGVRRPSAAFSSRNVWTLLRLT
jgi:hypothetical protein